MKKILALAVAALLAGCGSSDSNTAAGGQCMKDTDCKGERICESGACVSAAAAVVPGAQPTTDLQDMAPAEPDGPAAPSAPANGPAPEWGTGFGQGNFEFHLASDGVDFVINCPTQNGSDTQMSGMLLNRDDNTGQQIDDFQILIDGKSIRGPIDATSSVDRANFIFVYERLRKMDSRSSTTAALCNSR